MKWVTFLVYQSLAFVCCLGVVTILEFKTTGIARPKNDSIDLMSRG